MERKYKIYSAQVIDAITVHGKHNHWASYCIQEA